MGPLDAVLRVLGQAFWMALLLYEDSGEDIFLCREVNAIKKKRFCHYRSINPFGYPVIP